MATMLLEAVKRLSRHRVVLASGSPRRSELLRGLGIAVDVVPSKFAEDLPKCEASDYVRGTARSKAEEVAGRLAADGRRTLLIAADTVVVLDGHILEKPADAEHARNMIRSLSGRSHDVFTGVVLIVLDEKGAPIDRDEFAERTQVRFAPLSSEDIAAYVATGEPMDKAGGYGIQGIGGALIEGIEGCYFNVVGFPLHRFTERVGSLVARGVL